MRRAMAMFAALTLAGCAIFGEQPKSEQEAPESPPKPSAPVITEAEPEEPAPAPAPAPQPKLTEIETLMMEFERLRKLPATELAREQEAARQAFLQSRTDASRLRLAMALTVPGAPMGEETRALEVLEPLVTTPGAKFHALAFLLAAFIQEQRRLTGQIQVLQQNNQTLQQNAQALQQNVHGLQQKLDALRTLERSLTERGEPAQRRR